MEAVVDGSKWKLPLPPTMETSTSTDRGNFHVVLRKLPLTFMEVNLPSPNSIEISKVVFYRVRTEPYPGYLPRVLPYKELL